MIKKNYWINNILYCVKIIANKEYQERAWVKQEVYIPCSFGEIYCKLFDDCFIEEFINEKTDEFQLSDSQKSTLSHLICALDQYGDNPEIYTHTSPPRIDEAKMLSDPEWCNIQKMAQKVLDAFGKVKYDQEDEEWWLGSILYWVSKYSDIENQKIKWGKNNKSFFSTPVDMCEGLFIHCDFDYFMDEYAEKFQLTKGQIDALNQLRTQLKKTPFKTAHFEDILNDPAWQKLQTLAYKTCEQFPSMSNQ